MTSSELPAYCASPTVVLGCGNLLFGDDGFGCAVVEYLDRNLGLPDDVCVLDAGTGVRNLLFTMCISSVRPKRLLIVDAFDGGREPGEIFEVELGGIPFEKLDDFSMHHVPTSNLLRDLAEGCGVEVRVLACQTAPLPERVTMGLSAAVRDAVPRAAEWVVREYGG